jgi:formate/nitrite transporter FocA (FNT family)
LITLTQVLCQGCELITANYMFCTFACLAAAPEDRANEIKATVINWFVCWWLNLAGAILHFVIFAWQTGLIKTVTIDNDIYSDPTGARRRRGRTTPRRRRQR